LRFATAPERTPICRSALDTVGFRSNDPTVASTPNSDWEKTYDASLQAEDKRQGRVRGHPEFNEWFIDLKLLLCAVALAAAAVGWLGTRVGLPYVVGTVGSAVVLVPLACIALRNYYREQRR